MVNPIPPEVFHMLRENNDLRLAPVYASIVDELELISNTEVRMILLDQLNKEIKRIFDSITKKIERYPKRDYSKEMKDWKNKFMQMILEIADRNYN